MTTIQTVTGPIDSSQLGVCLPHEHIINDVSSWWAPTSQLGIDPQWFENTPVSQDILWELRNDPFGNRDNCRMDDVELAITELGLYKRLGGVSILEATSVSIGRNLPTLKQISERTGLTVVAGTGFYLDSSQPDEIKHLDVDGLLELLRSDFYEGVEGVRPGFIGEIGVSSDFTPAEQRSLQAACRLQKETAVPMQVHLPGWFRLGHQVLDLVEAEGVDPRNVVLCHMGPSGSDADYQQSLATRGAWIQYDMVGMEVFYADQGVQCPSDDDNARNLMGLADAGFAQQLLISQDIFLKSLLRHYGGPGFGHILQFFVPRLQRHGADDQLIEQLLVGNPQRLFDQAKETTQ